MAWVDDFTNLNIQQRRELTNYYSGLAEKEKITVHRQAAKLFHKLRRRAKESDDGEYQFSLVVLATKNYRDQAESGLTERRETTPTMIAELCQRRIARSLEVRAAKRAPLAAAVRRYRNDIRTLSAAGMSWVEIAHYLVTYHTKAFVRPGKKKAHIDPRYLARIWRQLENEKQTEKPGDSGDLMDD